jgi:four helix bundle protein
MKNNREYRGYRDLKAYQLSFDLAKEIHQLTKDFPKEERYSLTDQMRRSSRAIPAIIAEAWKKRRYPRYFVSKMTDASGEQAETTVWLDFARDFKYLSQQDWERLTQRYDEIGAMLHSMIDDPRKFLW